MIAKNAQQYCSDDIKNITNYEEAINDKNNIWVVHHILETDTDIKRSADYLKQNNLYYNRPAYELCFMKQSDHFWLHKHCKQITGRI